MPLARFFIAATDSRLTSMIMSAYSTRSSPSESSHNLRNVFLIFSTTPTDRLRTYHAGRKEITLTTSEAVITTESRLRGGVQLGSCSLKRVANAAGQVFHRNNRQQGDQYDQQPVFHQVLSFFLPKLLQNVHGSILCVKYTRVKRTDSAICYAPLRPKTSPAISRGTIWT